MSIIHRVLPQNSHDAMPNIILPRPKKSALSFIEAPQNPKKLINIENNNINDSQFNQLDSTRILIQQKYQDYKDKLASIEKSIVALQQRINSETDDMSKGNTSSFSNGMKKMGNLNSLWSEAAQINYQQSLLNKKLCEIKTALTMSAKAGYRRTLNPMKKNFREFGTDFNESLQNIDILLNKLSDKITKQKKELSLLNEAPLHIQDRSSKLQELVAAHNNNINRFNVLKESLGNYSCGNTYERIGEFKIRMQSLQKRIEVLQQKSSVLFQQTQNAVDKTENSIFKLKNRFNEQMSKSFELFQKKVINETNKIKAIENSTGKYIHKTEARLRKEVQALSKIRKRQVKNAIKNEDLGEMPFASDIERLKYKVDDFEKQITKINQKPITLNYNNFYSKNLKDIGVNSYIKDKSEKNSGSAKRSSKKKDIVEVYYRVDDTGRAHIIFVIDDDVILPNGKGTSI